MDLLHVEMQSSHDLSTLFKLSGATPLLLICLIIAVYALLKIIINPELLKKLGYLNSSDKMEVDENVPDFYSALKMSDKEWFWCENDRTKNLYNYMVANQ